MVHEPPKERSRGKSYGSGKKRRSSLSYYILEKDGYLWPSLPLLETSSFRALSFGQIIRIATFWPRHPTISHVLMLAKVCCEWLVQLIKNCLSQVWPTCEMSAWSSSICTYTSRQLRTFSPHLILELLLFSLSRLFVSTFDSVFYGPITLGLAPNLTGLSGGSESKMWLRITIHTRGGDFRAPRFTSIIRMAAKKFIYS